MPALITSVTCTSLCAINGTDCIGDTRPIINANITNLGASVCTLSSTVTRINTSFNTNNIGPRSTLGTLVSSLSVFNTSGSYIGYVPIYR